MISITKVYNFLLLVLALFKYILSLLFLQCNLKGFGQFRKAANTFYTTGLFGDNSTPGLLMPFVQKKLMQHPPAST